MIKFDKPLITRSRVTHLLAYALIFILAGFIGNLWMTRNQAEGEAPVLIAEDIQGRPVSINPGLQQNASLSSPLQDKPKLLYFFAEWCPICKVQHSVISSINKDYKVIGVAMQSGNNQKVREYVAAQGIDFSVINDENGLLSQSFGVNGVPAAFVIDTSGQIKYSTRGYATEAGLRSRIWLAEK